MRRQDSTLRSLVESCNFNVFNGVDIMLYQSVAANVSLFLQKCISSLPGFLFLFAARREVSRAVCPPPTPLGKSPTRLVVIVPATGQGPTEWQSFYERFKLEAASAEYDWLIFNHGIRRHTIGH